MTLVKLLESFKVDAVSRRQTRATTRGLDWAICIWSHSALTMLVCNQQRHVVENFNTFHNAGILISVNR